MPAKPNPTFLSRNLVAVIMIPSLIGIHIGWKMLQENRKLVTVEEQIEMPPITLANYVWNKLTNSGETEATKSSTEKTTTK